MLQIQTAIDSHIAFKKSFDSSINAQNVFDLSIFEKLNDELLAFGGWIESTEAEIGDLNQLKMLHKHFHYFAAKYTEYLVSERYVEAEMLQLALDSASDKVLRSLVNLKAKIEGKTTFSQING